MKSLLMYRGGVRAFEKPLVDAEGVEHPIHYKARTPNEMAAFVGADSKFAADEAGQVARAKHYAAFLAASMCEPTGDPMLTQKEAELIPMPKKVELLSEILKGSNESGDAAKN